jgi:hypothetical protein
VRYSKKIARQDVSKLKAMSDIDKSVILSHYKSKGMPFSHIGEHYRAAVKQAQDHVEFLMEVFYEKSFEEN